MILFMTFPNLAPPRVVFLVFLGGPDLHVDRVDMGLHLDRELGELELKILRGSFTRITSILGPCSS